MNTIWVVPISPIVGTHHVRLRKDAYVLSVGLSNGNLMVYAIVDPDEAVHDFEIVIAGVGDPLPLDGALRFLNRVEEWHVFVRL